ncbi:hypothetical protein, partial [Vibrio ezurae]
SLDSLIITDIHNQQLLIEKEDIAIDENGHYTVTGINVDDLADGTLTVTANSTDVDGNTATVTDTVVKDYTYGDDSDDDGADITPPSVSLTDNNGEEVINGEGETATISGYLGEGGKSLDSLIISDINNQQLLIAKEDIAIDENGNYTITGINVDDLADGILTVTASSTDVDGNTTSVTDTVEKDYTYGDDSDDDGSDITPPSVSLTDNNGEEVINGEGETAVITGYLGEGGEELTSLIITDVDGKELIIPSADIQFDGNGNYTVININVDDLADGVLTVTANSTDVDGNIVTVTDTVDKDYTSDDNSGDGAWGLTPKNGLSVAEGNTSDPIAVKLLEGGTVVLAANELLTFTFSLIGFSEGLTAQDFVLHLNTSEDYSSSSLVNSDGDIEVTVQNISGSEIVVGRGNSDEDLLSIEVQATTDNDVELDESFTLHLIDASIGAPKPSQDEVDVTIYDNTDLVTLNREFVESANEILATLGDDILQGTAEQDTFIWKSDILDSGTDLIQDFSVGEDGIVLDDILEPTQSDSIDALLNKIEVSVIGDDVTLNIEHTGGTQTIVIQDSRSQFGDSIANNGSFDETEILNQLIVKSTEV